MPVHNGASLLRESLECLRAQDYEDFEVVISDNASTDETEEICTEFVERDSRFRYLRHSENIGLLANFRGLLDMTEAPLFMWRAYDDLSDSNYISELVSLFDQDSGTRLAVPKIRLLNISGAPDENWECRLHPYQSVSGGRSKVLDIAQEMFHSPPNWSYGLWDRAYLADEQSRVNAAYPYPWASDDLVLFPPILDRAIRGSNSTCFTQRFTSRSHQLPETRVLRDLRVKFVRKCRSDIARRKWSPSEWILLQTLLPRYCDVRTQTHSRASRLKPVRRLLLRRLCNKLSSS
nr:glycosyltransferase [uncultured bacterium]